MNFGLVLIGFYVAARGECKLNNPIWDYFVLDSAIGKAQCKVCLKWKNFKNNAYSGNLARHLTVNPRIHGQALLEFNEKKRSLSQTALTRFFAQYATTSVPNNCNS